MFFSFALKVKWYPKRSHDLFAMLLVMLQNTRNL